VKHIIIGNKAESCQVEILGGRVQSLCQVDIKIWTGWRKWIVEQIVESFFLL
jgi:hypothetical protein